MARTNHPTSIRRLAALLFAVGAAARADAARITEFPVETAASVPQGITAGPDGRLWFCEGSGDRVGAITLAGVVTEYPIAAGAGCNGIASAMGRLYYAQSALGKLGIMTPDGSHVDAGTALSSPQGVAAGPDGRIWVGEQSGGRVFARRYLQTAPPDTFYYPVSTGSGPTSLVAGPDGRVWFTEAAGKIGACDPGSTSCAEFTVPVPGSEPWGIARGGDGNLWFTDAGANRIGRITPAGAITLYAVPTASSEPQYIAAGPDGALWFTENIGNKIGRVTTNGEFTEFPVPTPASFPWGIALGQDGNIWFTEADGNKIGRLQVVIPGDENGDGTVDVADVFYLVNFLFAGGPYPK